MYSEKTAEGVDRLVVIRPDVAPRERRRLLTNLHLASFLRDHLVPTY